jgi:hypothetical protein
MQTDTVFACYVEIDDFILEDGETLRVIEITDADDALAFLTKDEDGERFTLYRPPFEHMAVVTSFDEESVLDFDLEDV